VLGELERDRPFYDQSGGGVTFSGGEPLMQSAFLLELLQGCRERELHTALDTSGYAAWRVVEKAVPLVNLFLYDLKLVNINRHREHTGVSNRLILQNLRRLSVAGAKLTVRIPLIPGINDDDESLRQSGKFLSKLPNLPEVEIMPYHDIAEAKYEALGRGYQLPGLKPPTQERLAWVVQVLQSYGLRTSSLSLPQTQVSEVIYDDQRARAKFAPAVPTSG
jgi:pyruvate formate lyase activating enzyme